MRPENFQGKMLYDTDISIDTVAITMKPGWKIIVVLGLYPILLMTLFLFRVMLRPSSPIGEGFSIVSLLASADKEGLALLDGAGLSGKLKRPVFIGLSVNSSHNTENLPGTGKITSSFKTEKLRTRSINKGFKYS